MKILVICDEAWNDEINPNNFLSSWFEGFDAEFANVYCSPGAPLNGCCRKYFQVTDRMMFRSLLGGKKAGAPVEPGNPAESAGAEPERLYFFLKKHVTEELRALRDFLWVFGRYDEAALGEFISEFSPDIIFSARKASVKILRLERIIRRISGKPFAAFTGDDEYSLGQVRFSPAYWIRRLALRKALRENTRMYGMYFCLSEKQGEEYGKIFDINTGILFKCAAPAQAKKQPPGRTLRMVYAGKLYCGRWKPLVEISRAVKKLNASGRKFTLEIYTGDRPPKRAAGFLNDGENSAVRGFVTKDELERVYADADIALHVESLDLRNRLLTRHSFSTKIVDCLASGCAVMAVCWREHAGCIYLKKEDAALCVCNYADILKTLERIGGNPGLVEEYRRKAASCVSRNHSKEAVQRELRRAFSDIIKKS